MALTQVKGTIEQTDTQLPENEDSRACGLTLSRDEWVRVGDALRQVSDIADCCEPSIQWLEVQIDSIKAGDITRVTLSQSALAWSPVSIGLAMRVRVDPSLADIAVRLGSQMLAQSRRLQSAVGASTSDSRLD